MSILCSMVGATYVAAVAEIIRSKKGIQAIGNASISTSQSQFGGSSAYFDGTDDYLIANGDFSQTGDFTIEGWFRFNRVTGAQILMTIGNESTERAAVYTNGSTLYYDTYSSGTPDITCSGTISTGVWYHIAAVRSGSTITVYRDGTSVGTGSKSGTVGNATNAYFGADSNSISDYQGWMDEIRYSNTARYTANFTAPSAPFTNDSNTLLLIHCDGTNNSTYFEDDNGVRTPKGVSASGNAQISTAQSKFGGASALFDGVGDLITVNQSISETGAYTIECWFRITGWNANMHLFYTQPESTGRTVMYFPTTGTLYVDTYSSAQPDFQGATPISTTLALNTWYHMAYVRESAPTGTVKVYLDGVLKQTGSSDVNFGTGGLQIGSNNFNGYIDEFRISNTARYTAGFTPSTTPFINDANTLLLLHCDGTNASTVFRDDNGIGRAQKACIAVGQAQIDNAQSQFGGTSALFDGYDSRVQIQNHPDFALGTGDFTIEGWYRFHTSANRYNTIFNGSSNAVFPHVFTSTSGDTPPNRFVFVGGSTPDVIQGTQVWAINQWYHIALSRSSGTTRLFINGTLEGSVTNTANYTGSAVNLGASSTLTSDLMGWVDEFRISNIARYTANFTPPTAPFQNDANTLVLLHMDGTDTSTVFIDDNGTRPT